MRWLRQRDRGFAALRRAARTAVVMPSAFALADVVIGNAVMATFAAFGSFAMVLLVEFGGPMRDRLRDQAALAGAGAVLVSLGTLVNGSAGLAAATMALVAACVLFSGVVSSVLAGATTSLLLSFILPVSLSGPLSSLPDRLAGWGIASVAGLLAIRFLWPAPARDPVRGAAIAACRAMAARLRGDGEESGAVEALHAVFYATPYRPTGLSTAARAVIRLVDELRWLSEILAPGQPDEPAHDARCAAAAVLERSAELLDRPDRPRAPLRAAQEALRDALTELERSTMAGAQPISSLDATFRAQELSYVSAQIARNVELAAAAECRSWFERLLGRPPEGLSGPLAAAQERAGAHVDRHSVWLHNSLRGAIALGGAVLVADLTGVQHGFWVALGTLSVLRSNALATGQDLVRALLGTVLGLIAGGALIALIGTDTTVLWVLLPLAVLFAGFAPAISFLAGQLGFTVTLLVLFNIIAPAGWEIGLVRIEDVALGSAVSLAVGVLFWPRGAQSALGIALAEAYADSVEYLATAVRAEPVAGAAVRAAAASRRLDDAFRGYLAERGAKPAVLADATSLVTGVVGLRLAADAVLDLAPEPPGPELRASAEDVRGWYARFAAALTGGAALPAPLSQPVTLDAGAGVRALWTADHLDAARRLQPSLTGPASALAGVAQIR